MLVRVAATRALLLGLLLAPWAGCGSSSSSGTGDAGASAIGPSGGTVTSPDGRVRLVVPAAATASQLGMTIQELTSPPDGAVGPAYEIGPTGTVFGKPVTLVFSFAGVSLAGASPARLRVATHTSAGWQTVPSTVDEVSREVSGQILHLSPWALVVAADAIDGGDADAPASSDGGVDDHTAAPRDGDGDGHTDGGTSAGETPADGATGVPPSVACAGGYYWSADFDGDGTADCLRAEKLDLFFHKGVGAGLVSPASVTSAGALPFDLPSTNFAAVVADLSGDGRQDLFLAGPNTSSTGSSFAAYLLRGQADGTLTRFNGPGDFGNTYGFTLIPGSTDLSYNGLLGAVGDFTSDGTADILIATEEPGSTAIKWNVFTAPPTPSIGRDLRLLTTAAGFSAGVLGFPPGGAAVADVDSDGHLDGIVAVNVKTLGQLGPGGAVVIAHGRGDGTFDPATMDASWVPSTMVPGTSGALGVTTADPNGDHRPDLIVTFAAGPTTFYGDGAGHFSTTAP